MAAFANHVTALGHMGFDCDRYEVSARDFVRWLNRSRKALKDVDNRSSGVLRGARVRLADAKHKATARNFRRPQPFLAQRNEASSLPCQVCDIPAQATFLLIALLGPLTVHHLKTQMRCEIEVGASVRKFACSPASAG